MKPHRNKNKRRVTANMEIKGLQNNTEPFTPCSRATNRNQPSSNVKTKAYNQNTFSSQALHSNDKKNVTPPPDP